MILFILYLYYRIRNEEVLERIGEGRILWKSLWKIRTQMMKHTLRHGELLKVILMEEFRKRKRRGRPRLEYFDQIIGNMGWESFREVKDLAGMGQSLVEKGGCVKQVLGLCNQ